ncbi:MAG: dephospho-CoA kinase [Chlamydiia bacterium]|nr:dephospho-CoA kinase [Chlamydiia bacterium]
MLTLKKIAITGGLSCGKSTVCRFLGECGAYVVSADDIVHQLLSPDTSLGQQVIELLGSDIVVNGVIDRRLIAAKVFGHPDRLGALEGLVHPAVRVEINRRFEEVATQNSHKLFVAEIPLLFEGGFQDYYDTTVAVVADSDLCLERFKAKTGHNREEFDRRMARQWTPVQKAHQADFVIENTGKIEELRSAVQELYKQLTFEPPREKCETNTPSE